MIQRWLLLAVALLTAPNLADAQAVVGVPVSGPDPYAMVPATNNPYWWGQGFAFPTTSCIKDRFWVEVDYLLMRTDGMDVPALVTTSPNGTSAGDAGVLGREGTKILYGNGELNEGSANGARLRSGMWFRQGRWAIEGEFFRLRNSTETFSSSNDGTSILARPYFDIVSGDQASEVIAFPGTVAGGVQVSSSSELRSGLINFRRSLIPLSMLGTGDGCDPPDRVDWIVGYRVVELKDDLTIGERRDSISSPSSLEISRSDSFTTKNQFNGLQLGVVYLAHFRRASLESMIRVALGNNQQSASIRGGSTINDSGTTNNFTGGLLAQRTNIGDYQRDEFTMIPELGLNLGFRVTRCLHANIGYSLIYFPNVWRAGDQIDTDVNPGLIPPESVTLVGSARPQFRAVEDDYWAHGLNFGATLKF